MLVWVREEDDEEREGVVPYDHLVLATGLQFSPPPMLSDSPGEDAPLIYHANDGLGVLQWAQQHLQPEGSVTTLTFACAISLSFSLSPSLSHTLQTKLWSMAVVWKPTLPSILCWLLGGTLH